MSFPIFRPGGVLAPRGETSLCRIERRIGGALHPPRISFFWFSIVVASPFTLSRGIRLPRLYETRTRWRLGRVYSFHDLTILLLP